MVAVAGASSAVGDFLLPRLAAAGCGAIALSRARESLAQDGARDPGPEWVRTDLAAPLPTDFRASMLVCLAPLWLLPERLQDFAAGGVTRVVALGSTSLFTKRASANRAERDVAALLASAEAALAELCGRLGIAWTVLRPTLIYGTGRDANIGAIAAFIRRFGFFPVAGAASGLRSPVHADDVAQACVAALGADAARNRAYDIAGGEIVTYREMVLRVFEAIGAAPRVVALPPWLMQALASVAAQAGIPGINSDLVRRMNRDQVFDHADAMRDLGYTPRAFHPKI